MQDTPQCEGKIKLGPLPWEISERLAQVSANWLEFVPEDNSIVVKDAKVEGCPALTGIPCDIITILGSIPADIREKVPGGEVYFKDPHGQPLRLLVAKGEVCVQWPRIDYSAAVPVSPESVLSAAGRLHSRITGWARFAGSVDRAAELQSFADQFGGTYPEAGIPSECEQQIASIQFKGADIHPQELLDRLKDLAHPPESLQANLDVTCVAAGPVEHYFRICIRDGSIQALKPSLWDKRQP
jgi:hypothetical protein